MMEFPAFEKLEVLKAMADARRPFSPQQMEQIDAVLLGRRIYSTNAFEDNSLSLEETRYFLDTQRMVVGKLEREFGEVRGILNAIQHLRELLQAGQDLTEDVIKKIHQVLAEPIQQDERYFPGQYKQRDLPILIADGTRLDFISHDQVPQAMAKLLAWYHAREADLPPAELAARFHCCFSHIHPFMEANGRMARLIDDFILERAGYGPTLFEDREQYYAALRAAERSLPAPDQIPSPEQSDPQVLLELIAATSGATLQTMLDVLEGRIKLGAVDLGVRLQIFDRMLLGDIASQDERRIQEEKETTKLAISREIEEMLKQQVRSRMVTFVLTGPAKFQQNNQQLSPLIGEVTGRNHFSFTPAEILYEYHFAPDLKEIEARGWPIKPFMKLLGLAILSHGKTVGIYSAILPFEFGHIYIKQENRNEINLRLDPDTLREMQDGAAYQDWDLNALKRFLYDSLDQYFSRIETDYWQAVGGKEK